ncbi:MAG TPA: hypothetical protein VFE19_06715 [Jatrophihabitantaceae bacterium]|nr:hypothetical protein [Jatrophihabitantaceae bacterium]
MAVIGPGSDPTESELCNAYGIGRLLAEHRCTVITGGLGGVMAEAARGCAEAGGTTIGLLPGAVAAAGNEHLTVALPTGLGELRNLLVVRAADGVIAVGGSWGTLSELALAKRMHVPTVSLDGWQISDASGTALAVDTAQTPADAVSLLLRRMGSLNSMAEPPEDERIESRGHLLPEEEAVGSDDPQRQAEVILEDSDKRTAEPEETKRRSTQTPD